MDPELIDISADDVEVESDGKNIEHPKKKIKLDNTQANDKPMINNDDDEDQVCSICFMGYTNSGDHRLCSLKCGHLYGYKCIYRWLVELNGKKCPECNATAKTKDIRMIYSKTYIQCTDTTEIENLKKELQETIKTKDDLELEVGKHQSMQLHLNNEIEALNKQINELQKIVKGSIKNYELQYNNTLIKSQRSIYITNDKSCRALAYNPWHNILVASYKNNFTRIKMDTIIAAPMPSNHTGEIRDLAFHKEHLNYLLSVGMDGKVLLMDLRRDKPAHEYNEDFSLWSCCWSNIDKHKFSVGGNKGNILEYDIRNLKTYVSKISNENYRSPVGNLISVAKTNPYLSTGGLIACHLNKCLVYASKEGKIVCHEIDIEGRFTCLRYNDKDHHILLSSRPCNKFSSNRHMVCSIQKLKNKIQFNVVHTFTAGAEKNYLSKTSFLNNINDTIIVAYNGSDKNIVGWSISSGEEVFNMPMTEQVRDICCFENEHLNQAILTTSKLHMYHHLNVA